MFNSVKMKSIPALLGFGSIFLSPKRPGCLASAPSARATWRGGLDMIMICIWLVVGPPLWKIWKSIGMISNPNINGKIKNGNQTTNQACCIMLHMFLVCKDFFFLMAIHGFQSDPINHGHLDTFAIRRPHRNWSQTWLSIDVRPPLLILKTHIFSEMRVSLEIPVHSASVLSKWVQESKISISVFFKVSTSESSCSRFHLPLGSCRPKNPTAG